MDRVVAARKLLTELVKAEQIEVRRTEIVGRDLAAWCEKLGRPPSGQELEDWLGDHQQVTECYAGATLLDELAYRYLTPPPPPAAEMVEARNPELEKQLQADPDNRDSYLVYADYLQSHGDPLGELIALGVAATAGSEDDMTRFERARKALEPRFVPMAGQLSDKAALVWRNGVIHAIEEMPLHRPTLVLWEELLKLRAAQFLQSITLRHTCTPDLDRLIADFAAPTLRSLALEACQGPLPSHVLERSLHTLSVSGSRVTIQRLPRELERLELRVTEIATESVLHFDVRELHVTLNETVAEFFHSVSLPRVQRLTVAFADARVVALLKEVEMPELAHLAITDGLLDAKTFTKIAKLPIAGQLKSLALTNVEIADETIAAMAKHRQFAALEEIDVSFNELTRDGLAAAKALAPKVISARQHKRGNGVEKRIRRFAGSRLQVAEDIAEPKAWKNAGVDGEIRWARYRGDDEYELFITTDLARYGCSCPSSIQPCKHVVALALIAERNGLPEGKSGGIELRVDRRIQPARYDEVEE